MPGVRVTMICRDAHTPYSGMLLGLIAGHYTFDETHIDLRPLCVFAGARFYADEVLGVDLAEKRVLCRNRPPVPYDVISFNVGSTPAMSATPGAEAYAVPVKPIQRFVAHWEDMKERVLVRREPTQIGVVGGGAGGVELVLAIQYRLGTLFSERDRSSEHLTFHLLTDQPHLCCKLRRRPGPGRLECRWRERESRSERGALARGRVVNGAAHGRLRICVVPRKGLEPSHPCEY